MLQQAIALSIITVFIWRLINQKRKNKISKTEFIVWLSFWLLGALAIIFIRQIDNLVIALGFSGSGINFLLYLSVIVLFYLVFKMRLTIAKTEANITKITRHLALNKEDDNKQE